MSETETRYCEKCGQQISTSDEICPNCGAATPIKAAETKFCQHCGEKIDKDCVVCPKCGKQVSELKAEQPNIIINNSNNNSNINANIGGRPGREKNKWVAFFLCLFLGGLGVHRFYEGKIGTGILWLLTLGLGGIGWIVDLVIIATKPNPYYVY